MPTKTKSRPNRALHLIDLENIVGGSVCDAQSAARVYRTYTSSVPQTPYDHYVLATSHHNLLATSSWPGAQRLCKSGPNGAEIALCEYADELDLPTLYSNIVVASGDHYFATSVKTWKESGLYVTVVGVQQQVSHELYRAANTYIGLPNLSVLGNAACVRTVGPVRGFAPSR